MQLITRPGMQFRIEIRRLRRHDLALLRDLGQLFEPGWID